MFFYLQVADDEISDNSAECVVCLSDVRDTLILPCRHLCLCNACADTLRYQANCCPICRLREFPSATNNLSPKYILFYYNRKSTMFESKLSLHQVQRNQTRIWSALLKKSIIESADCLTLFPSRNQSLDSAPGQERFTFVLCFVLV